MMRDETLYQIGFSIRLEKMHCTLLGRFDRASNFLQLLLGIAVVATSWPVVVGIAVSTLAAISFVYQPACKSIEAKIQKQKYEKLQARASTLTDSELEAEFAEVQAGDSVAIGSLLHPAHVGECIRLERTVDVSLTWYEKLMAFLAGDLPRQT